MKQKPDITCIVLAGGASVRFGKDKGLALLRGQPLIAHVVERLRGQTSGCVGINAPHESPYARFADLCVPDILGEGLGPLAGLHAALSWAQGCRAERVMTCAVDTPFLPEDLVGRLAASQSPAIATSLGRSHPVCGIWPVVLLPELTRMLEGGERAAHVWARACGAAEIDFGAEDGRDPFFNINRAADLLVASKL